MGVKMITSEDMCGTLRSTQDALCGASTVHCSSCNYCHNNIRYIWNGATYSSSPCEKEALQYRLFAISSIFFAPVRCSSVGLSHAAGAQHERVRVHIALHAHISQQLDVHQEDRRQRAAWPTQCSSSNAEADADMVWSAGDMM